MLGPITRVISFPTGVAGLLDEIELLSDADSPRYNYMQSQQLAVQLLQNPHAQSPAHG